MLEAYELRDALRKARKELAESLYQHDAACRVIARLQGDKEAAEKALEDLQAQVVSIRQQAATAATAAATEGAPTEGPEPKRVRRSPNRLVLHPAAHPTLPNAYGALHHPSCLLLPPCAHLPLEGTKPEPGSACRHATCTARMAPRRREKPHSNRCGSLQARPDDSDDGLTAQDLADMEAKRLQLSTERRRRDPNLPGLAAAADLDGLTQAAAQPLHSPSQPGVLTVALQPASGPQEEPKVVATGSPAAPITA